MRQLNSRPVVAVMIGEGVALFEMAAAWEVFATDRSALGVPWYDAFFCAPDRGPIRTGSPGVTVSGARPLSALKRASTVIVPPMIEKHPDTLEALRQAHGRGARIASLCTGAFVLAAAGLLDGRTATTHWTRAATLAERYPAIDVDPRVLYTESDGILTSAGSAACLDLCLHMVAQDYGADIANQVARDLVVPPHRAGGQAQFVETPMLVSGSTDLFADTLEWAIAHLADPISVDLLAHRAGMSSRTFARRFRECAGVTPHQWVLRQRVQLAQRLLEVTDLPIEQVATDSGLGSATNLRIQFRQVLGTSPTSYRRTFQAQAV